jgi:hypothetical protein
MKTNAYIDGFNLYYGCFKHDPDNQRYKWLDLRALCQAVLPDDDIHRIHYFTAMVSETSWNPGAPLRQETYIRALRTCSQLYVHLGKFQPVFRTGMLFATAQKTSTEPVTISTWEEKGSDVNLATRLLTDAMDGDFEQALVISNDSDLTEPIRAIKQRFSLPIIVVSPYPRIANKLRRAASASMLLDKSLLATSQFRDSMKDKKGRLISRPVIWS